MPEEAILKQIEEMQNPPKRRPGRPKGSKTRPGGGHGGYAPRPRMEEVLEKMLEILVELY